MAKPRRASPNDQAFGCPKESHSTVVDPKRAIKLDKSIENAGWRKALIPLAGMVAFSLAISAGAAVIQRSAGPTVLHQASTKAANQANKLNPNNIDYVGRSATRPKLTSKDAFSIRVHSPNSNTLSVSPFPTASPSPRLVASTAPKATPSPAKPSPTTPSPKTPALAKVIGTNYAKASDVRVRNAPSMDAKIIKQLVTGEPVQITAITAGEWQQVQLDHKPGWVAKRLLDTSKPQTTTSISSAEGNYSTSPCNYGSSIEAGITSNTKRVFRAFCGTFPQIKTYGGYRRAESWSYHTRGAAIDAMVNDHKLGWQMAKWAAANSAKLNIDQVIYAQHIWTKDRPIWRSMADRGSVTANHYDHVHISVG